MEHEFTVGTRDDQILITLHGDAGSETYEALLAYLVEVAVPNRPAGVIIDFENAVDLPATAYRALSETARTMRRSQIPIYAVHVSERTRACIRRMQLDRGLPLAGSITDVIRRKR